MSFEILPNELLIECFKYLNAIDIFHSFDGLNYRFNTLIRNIPLYVDFLNVEKSRFDQFCLKISLNPEIKKQIYSLQLSNENIFQIYFFLIRFSLEEFSNLRSLILIKITSHNVSQLIPNLPLLSQLICFRAIDCSNEIDKKLSILPISQLQILTIPILIDRKLLCNISSIISLTIYYCSMNNLNEILRNASQLKYLSINIVNNFSSILDEDENNSIISHQAIYLKQLIIKTFNDEFYTLVTMLKQTPNLQNLTLFGQNEQLLNADQWEYLITSSLPCLQHFNFKFECFNHLIEGDPHEILKKFQSDFWHKRHHWYTEYTTSKKTVSIYTIPHMSYKYTLTDDTNIYYDERRNHLNIFNNVTDLTIDLDALTDNCQLYFSNVITLTIQNMSLHAIESCLNENHIKSLRNIVNLTNVKELTIIKNSQMVRSSVLLEILKQASNISSLSIDQEILIPLLDDNNELCQYLKKMIKKLNINPVSEKPLENLHLINKFWETFSNIEHLTCIIDKQNGSIFFLQKLQYLIHLHLTILDPSFECETTWLKEQASKLDIKILVEDNVLWYTHRSIWILRENIFTI